MYGFQPKSARGKTVPKLADGGSVPFGSRGVAGVRDLIPKMQAMGFQQAATAPADTSNTARLRAMIPQMEAMGYKQQPQALADGGMVHSIKGMLGLRPKTREELLAADAKAQERNREAAAKMAERAAQQPAPAASAPQSAITDYTGMSAAQRREKEQGLKNGGMVKPHGFKAGGLIRGPGTGTSDSIETEKRPGTFIMPADSTQAIGPEALEELGEPEEMGEEAEGVEGQAKAVPVRLSNGEFEFSPEQVQALGEAVLTVLRNATHERTEEGHGAIPKAAGFAPRQFFADGGMIENDVTRVGNSYSGGNVGGSVSINGQAGAGTMSTVPAPVVPAPTPAAAPAAAAAPTATPAAPAAPAAAPAAPMGWAERNAQRNLQVTASSILDSPERKAAQLALGIQAPAAPGQQNQPAAVADTTPPPMNRKLPLTALMGTQPTFGFQPRGYANGGTVQGEDERARRIAQIPVGGTMPAPPADGSGSSEFTRNVNNGLNALGGMGVVASVPLRAPAAAQELRGAYQTLTGPAAKAAAPTADFIAGAGPNATTMANTIPRLGNAPTPVLPGTNAALQQGAQANAMSGAVRAASGASAGATGLGNTQPNDPTAAAPAAAPAPATQSEYSRQMSAVGGALADGAAWLGKTIVSAPGYGFSRPSAAPAPAPALTGATTTAGAGRGATNPAPVNPAQPVAAAPAPTNAPTNAPAAPTQPPTNEVMPGVYRHGRGQYSDNAAGMGMPANFTGRPSAQNMAAADALVGRQIPAGFQPAGVQAPVVRNSTNDWAVRNNLRNLAVSASSITANGGRFDQSGPGDSPEVAAYKAALSNDFALQQAQPGMDQAAMRESGANQRTAVQDAGATERTVIQDQGATAREAGRTALAGEELGLKRTAAGFQTRAAAQLESLQNAYAAEKDPAKQAALARQIREIQGKEQPARYKVAAGGQQIDANGVAYKVPDRVFNEQTGEFSDGATPKAPAAPSASGAPATPANKAQYDALPKGAQYIKNGVVYVKG